jgi:surface carbohydrate biosynthesis protein (TIGR04326 family)
MQNSPNKIFTISDNETKDQNNIVWTNNTIKVNNISITEFIEKNADKFKKDYIKIINNLENISIKNKELYNFFSLNKHFSFLWISDVYEKSIYKNHYIINQLKLFALKYLIKQIKPELIYINIKNEEDEKSIVKLCEYLKVNTKINKKNTLKINVREFFFVKICFAFIKFLRFVYLRLTFEKVDFELLKKKKNLFFTYSIYSNFEDIKNGVFNSVYWDPLIKKKFLKNDCAWCNIFFHQKNKLNYQSNLFKNLDENHYNFFIEQLFDIKIFFKILLYWIKNIFKIRIIKKELNSYLFKSGNIHLSHFIERDFINSFIGLEALTSLYYFFLIEKLSKKIKKPDKIFYLFENQGWEKSLNFHFFSKSKLIAINHASIRFWDLRFNFSLTTKNKYIPNNYAANSKDSFDKLIENQFPSKNIISLESLRYHHLGDEKIKIINKNQNLNNLLIVSDFDDRSNDAIIELLNNAERELLNRFNITLKEHPLKKIKIPKHLNIKKTNKSLVELRETNYIAIVSNTTSAISDLIILGYNTFTLIDKSSINLSPLRGSKKINIIENFHDILDMIELKSKKIDNYIDESDQFYYYSKDLNLWQKLFNES